MNRARIDAETSRVTPQNVPSRWTAIRYTLGVLQMLGAGLALVFLLTAGVTTPALIVVVLTGLTTTISVLLFGGRR